MKNLFSGLIGMAMGVVVGAYLVQYASTARGRKMRYDISRAMRQRERAAEAAVDTARERAARLSVKVAERVSQGAHHVADKVDRVKEQLHSVVSE